MSPASLRLGFAGTPGFAAIALHSLLDSPHEVCAVYSQPDRRSGRGQHVTASPVKQLAQAQNIPVYQPADFKEPQTRDDLDALQLDCLVVVAYGLILPQSVLDLPRMGCLNVHASLLPRWRGAAPIERALLAGDEQTGISIMQMDAGLDTGPVLLQAQCPIDADDTALTLHDKLARLGGDTLLRALAQRANGTEHAQPQADAGTCYAAKITRDEALLDWQEPAEVLARKIRAFNPRPGMVADLGNTRLKIWQAEYQPGSVSGAPGTVLPSQDQAIVVATGDGVLLLREVQLPGKKRVNASDLLNSRPELGAP